MATNRPGYLREYYARCRRQVVEKLGGRCVICGESGKPFHIHHLEPLRTPAGRGSLTRLVEWRKGGRELMLLCNDCHRRGHWGQLDDPAWAGLFN